MLLSSLIYAFSVSISVNFYSLLTASILPLILLSKNFKIPPQLLKLNILNLIMIITFALTWPIMKDGFMKGILTALRVNFIFIVFSALIFPRGIAGIYNDLKIPMKFRILVILTLRGIFILRERFDSALTALKLRAPDLKGIEKLKTFAYITGSVLLQSSVKSENILRVIKSRGGFEGFSQNQNENKNLIIPLCFTLYGLSIIILNYV